MCMCVRVCVFEREREGEREISQWTLNSQSTMASLVVSLVKPMTSLRSNGVYDGISHWWWDF